MKSPAKSLLVAAAFKGISVVAIFIVMLIVALPQTACAKNPKTSKELASMEPQIFRIEELVAVHNDDQEISYSILQPDGSWQKQAITSLVRHLDHFPGQVFVGCNPPKLITFFFFDAGDSRQIVADVSEADNLKLAKIKGMILTFRE